MKTHCGKVHPRGPAMRVRVTLTNVIELPDDYDRTNPRYEILGVIRDNPMAFTYDAKMAWEEEIE